MASITYTYWKPIDFLQEGMNKKTIQEGVFEPWIVWKYISNLAYTVREIVETGLHHMVPDLSKIETLRWTWEYNTRELLKDTHNTFWLFMNWLLAASSHLKSWKNTSVELYKEDVNNKEFVQGVKFATDEWKYASKLTLDIRPDDYGYLGKKSIEKLQEVSQLWVWISIEAFSENTDGEISIDSIRSLIHGRIRPKFIKISNIVLEKIKNNNVTKPVLNLYRWLISMWIHIIEYFTWTIKKENAHELSKKKKISDALLDSSYIEYEPMFTYEWDIWAEEYLVRFSDWIRTDLWLLQLQELWHTEDLVIKMLWRAITAAKEWKRVSINLYIKDLWSHRLLELIKNLTLYILPKYRKNIIFELLEEKYGLIDEKFIKHVRMIQENWFSIAIDDLYVSEQNKWMSIEILDELLGVDVYPDYIKLDGKHSMAIRDGSITQSELAKIGSLIWQFAYKKPITVVAEWIQDMAHAKQIQDFFYTIRKNDISHTMNEITIIFQGREIKAGVFGEKYSLK